MKKLSIWLLILSFVMTYGLAREVYIIQRGDTLSGIVQKKFPLERVYGKQGKLAQILAINPQINNPHRIGPGQEVVLDTSITSAQLEERPEILKEPVWTVAVYAGAKFLSISQTGALGKANVGVLLLNNLHLKSEFVFDEWKGLLEVDSYHFKYKSLSSSGGKQISSLKLGLSHDWLRAGAGIEQLPLFMNEEGRISMHRQNIMLASLGIDKEFVIEASHLTRLKVKGLFKYPLSASSDDVSLKSSSLSGYGVEGGLEISRQIWGAQAQALHASWFNEFSFLSISVKNERQELKGVVRSKYYSASSGIGLQFTF